MIRDDSTEFDHWLFVGLGLLMTYSTLLRYDLYNYYTDLHGIYVEYTISGMCGISVLL